MKVVVQRYSALGDIMMLLPILQAAKEQYPHYDFTLVSRGYLAPLFDKLDIGFHAAELESRHKGFAGLYRLANEISQGFKPDVVIDAHQVLRSKSVNAFLKTMGTKVHSIEKNRKERAALTRAKNKVFKRIKPVYQIYLDAFAKAGIDIDFDPKKAPLAPYSLLRNQKDWWQSEKASFNLGIAPTAKHKAKQWPLEQMQYLMQSLGVTNIKLFLFGGKSERQLLEELGDKSGAQYTVVAGQFNLDQEIALIKEMDLMLTMDSSNMHMAAWAGTKVISIWGGTHPHAGFKAYRQSDLNQLGLSHRELSCRPCSVFGNKECWRGDYACFEGLPHQKVRDHINMIISES